MTFTTRPELSGSFGMVASTHWLASGAGMSVLERGGNAFDAAVAAGFVLQVVRAAPERAGRRSAGGRVVGGARRAVRGLRAGRLAGAGRRGAAARLARAGRRAGHGLLPACVPGAFDGWMLMLLEHGTWRLRDVLEYAIGYAATGFPALKRITDTIAGVAELFREEWTSSAAHWLPARRRDRGCATSRWPRPTGGSWREAAAATGDRDGQIQHARDQWLRGLGGRGDRGLHGHRGARRVGAAPLRAADRGRPGGLERDVRGAGDATTTAA